MSKTLNFSVSTANASLKFSITHTFDMTDQKYPTMGPYWEQKRPDMTKINIPTYLSGSDVSSLHTMGTLRAWLEIPSKNKWLRWSGLQEWYDLWCMPENQKDLQGFFDRFLKDKTDNGWVEETPRVRMSVLQFGDEEPIEGIVVKDWPIPGTEYKDFHLNEGGKLSLEQESEATSVSYDSESPNGAARFTYKFEKDTRILGLPKAHLYMSCKDHDDLCVFLLLQKLNKEGNVIKHVQIPMDRRWVKKYEDIPKDQHAGTVVFTGATGQLRASRRKIDRSKSIHPQYPFHPHDEDEKITPGDSKST